MTFTNVTVTRDYDMADGSQPTGKVTFTLDAPMVNAGHTIVAAPLAAPLNALGQIAIVLAANTDPTTSPSNPFTSYLVREDIVGAYPVRTYYVRIPHNQGTTVDLGTLVTITVPVPLSYPPNATDAALRDRTTHSGSQPISSVTNLTERLDMLDGVLSVGNAGAALTLVPGNGVGTAKLLTLNTATCVLTFGTPIDATRVARMELLVTQDGTGSRLITWPASVKWVGGAPVLSTAAGAVDQLGFITYNGGTSWFGRLLGKGYV